jgi:hypothetical protein
MIGKYVLVKSSVARKDERLLVAPLGEYYDDLLAVYAFVADRTRSVQANFLLCEKLREEEPKVRESIAYLAKKRGVEPEKLWNQILKGEAKKISPEEIAQSASPPAP